MRRLIITEAARASYGSSGKSPQTKPCKSSARFLCMLNSCSGISRLSPSVITQHMYHFFTFLLNDHTDALQPARPKYIYLITTKTNKCKQMKDSCRKPEYLQGICLGINDISGNSICSFFFLIIIFDAKDILSAQNLFWQREVQISIFPSGALLDHHTENNSYCVRSEVIFTTFKKCLEQEKLRY